MEGYGTMASEAAEQLREMAINRPTHVFVQAGVARWLAPWWATSPTCIPITRPPSSWSSARLPPACTRALPPATATRASWTATCLHHGRPVLRRAQHLGWDILRNHATAFVSCPDWVSARGMRMLGVPVKGDPVVISGESGAVGMGLIAAIMETDEYKELREAIGLDRFSQVLMFSTEGNTDPMKFRKVLWDGEYPTV